MISSSEDFSTKGFRRRKDPELQKPNKYWMRRLLSLHLFLRFNSRNWLEKWKVLCRKACYCRISSHMKWYPLYGINMKWIFWYIELQKSIVIWKWIYFRTPEIAMHGAGIQVKLVGNNLKLEYICKHMSNEYHHNILLTKCIAWCSVCSVGYICHKISFMKLENNWK